MTISSTDDYISFRDVDKRVDELTEERGDLVTAVEEAQEAVDSAKIDIEDFQLEDFDQDTYDSDGTTEADRELVLLQDALDDAECDLTKAKEELEDWNTDNAADLEMWIDVRDEMSCYKADFLISEDVWTEYVQELFSDVETLDGLPGVVLNNIDWAGVAEDVKPDYSIIEIEGTTFYCR